MLYILKKLTFNIAVELDALIDPVCFVIDPSAESILDVGCGQGYPMRLIKSIYKFKKIVGVDLFKKYIKEAKAADLHDEYVLSDIRKMKFAANSYDIVLASHVIEHLPFKDTKKFVKDLERIAKKQVIIATPIGQMNHPAVDNNKLQIHLSHFYPEDFEKMGYQVLKYGRKSILGEKGVVHKVKSRFLRQLIFLAHIMISPLFYLYQPTADYYFVAYKKIDD